MVSVSVPVQATAGEVENAVKGLSREGVGREHQDAGQICSIWSQNQISVAGEDADVVSVLVERMLPAPLHADTDQRVLAGMLMGIAVVGLVRILRRIVRVHIVR